MFFLLISLALSAAAPEATTSQPSAKTARALEKKSKPERVCRRITDTGSRLSYSECRTREQWDRRADETGKWMDQDKK